MLNPSHLRTLSVVLRAGSFAAAGRQLGYTGSAVSQQMSALETDSGLVLFERGAHGVRPTAAAHLVSERARETLGAFASLETAVREMATGSRGRLGLGSFPTASELLVPGALARFTRSFAGVEVRFDDGEPKRLLQSLAEGDLDVAVVYRYDSVPQSWPPGSRRQELLTESLRLLVPDFFRLDPSASQLSDFADAAWIATRAGSAGSLALERACAAAGFEPKIRYRTNDYDVIRSFVRAGLGVAVAPQLAYVRRPGLRIVEATDLSLKRHVEVLTVVDRQNPTTDAMVAALKASAAVVIDAPGVRRA